MNVLVTGATGFVGGALLARLMADGVACIAIVRAADRAAGRARLAESLARFMDLDRVADAIRATPIVVGDLADAETYADDALATTTHVVHAAACTSFVSERETWRTNVDGTRCLAEHVARLPTLERFVHVSTAYVCGDRPNAVVDERDALRDEHRYVNGYTRSKAAAERLLRAMQWPPQAVRGAERLVVVRPSVVIGHTTRGVAPSPSLFWYYRAMAALACGPFALDDRRDIVPVDYVADALAFLLRLVEPRHDTYHVSAGAHATPLRVILERLGPAGASALDARWRKVSAEAMASLAPSLLPFVATAEEASHLARGLGACARFGELGVHAFDNARLLTEGFPPPPAFADVLDTCVANGGTRASLYAQMVDDA